MRHFAQVQINSLSGEKQVCILASENPDGSWQIGNRHHLPFKGTDFAVGMLIVIDIDAQNQIQSVLNQTTWILDVLKRHLSNESITPEFVRQEQEKVEKWRQEITAQNQDLIRRELEIETRREQLQELEKKLADAQKPQPDQEVI